MQRRSPPKHRHDGTSPLPLGMDWSPPPRKWDGRDTVWPHDPRTGWSYCVTIPSWNVLPRSKDSDPVVFYRVQVGIQTPEGVTSCRTVLRRFNDFLNLCADLKKAFPRKTIPSAPPKGLVRLKSRAQLEERRLSLEQWMTKMLSDIEFSRSVAVASFLELEAAARSSFNDTTQQPSELYPESHDIHYSTQLHPHRSSSVGSSSITPEYGSDTAYETSEVGTPRQRKDYNSEIGLDDLSLDEDLASPIEKLVKYGMTNIDEGLFMGQTILEQLEGIPKNKVNTRDLSNIIRKVEDNVSASKSSNFTDDRMGLYDASEQVNMTGHSRKLSDESAGSNMSSLRGSELSNPGILIPSANGSPDLSDVAENPSSLRNLGNTESDSSGNGQVVLPLNQQYRLNRILVSMQQRLVTAKTDMEDLIARLNQEIAAKDYLATKVKDLEVELDTSKEKSKETLQHAIQIERERFTQMKWDMEELRRKSLEMELKLKSDQKIQAEKSCAESSEAPCDRENALRKELDATKEQLNNLLKEYKDLEVKSKADIKVLVKEVKSLRASQTGLKQQLSISTKEKTEVEELFERERNLRQHSKTARQKLLEECRNLHSQFQENSIKLPSEENCKELLANSSSVAEALDLLKMSDDQISLLLEKAQLLVHKHETSATDAEKMCGTTDEVDTADDELRKMLADILISNARLKKQMNYFIRNTIELGTLHKQDEEASESTEL